MRAYANGLLARGIRKGDTFALLARNSLDWALLDFALARIGAVGVPIYASSSARDVGYLLAHSEAVGIVCEDAEQLAKVESAPDETPALEHVLTYHDLDGLAAHGRDYAARTQPRSTRRRPRSARTTSTRSSTRRERQALRRAAC